VSSSFRKLGSILIINAHFLPPSTVGTPRSSPSSRGTPPSRDTLNSPPKSPQRHRPFSPFLPSTPTPSVFFCFPQSRAFPPFLLTPRFFYGFDLLSDLSRAFPFVPFSRSSRICFSRFFFALVQFCPCPFFPWLCSTALFWFSTSHFCLLWTPVFFSK